METPVFTVNRIQAATPAEAQRITIGLVARAIRSGSSYLPIRNLAAALATRARPKDYLGQVRAIYEDFLRRWRYVKDTHGVETIAASPRALWHLVLAGEGRGVGDGLGAGDCDDAAAAIGAELAAIGMPVRIATARNPLQSRGLFSHIFVQALVPGVGWISVDPVGHPAHGFAWTPPHSAIATWDLDGRQLGGDRLLDGTEEHNMSYHGFGAVGSEYDYQWQEITPPAGVMGDGDPLPWDVYGLAGFGAYCDTMGYIEGGRGYMIEVDEDNEVDDLGNVRTPMLELSPGPYELANRFGVVLDGTLALGDDGSVYEYDGMAGFFKKLIHKAKKGLKRLGKKVLKGTEKLLKKTKFGKALVKLKNRVVKVAMKVVKPLTKFVGKWASKLAPIAAMIPGVGTVAAGYLTAAGTAAKLLDKHGLEFVEMTVTDKKGRKKRVRKLAGKPKQILEYQKAMKRAGKEAEKLPRHVLEAGAAKMKAYGGRALPRESLLNKQVLKKGTPEWFAAMKARGHQSGIFRPEATAKIQRPVKAFKTPKQIIADARARVRRAA